MASVGLMPFNSAAQECKSSLRLSEFPREILKILQVKRSHRRSQLPVQAMSLRQAELGRPQNPDAFGAESHLTTE